MTRGKGAGGLALVLSVASAGCGGSGSSSGNAQDASVEAQPPDASVEAQPPDASVEAQPTVAGCSAASACGNRQYCNKARTCICILTPEGTHQCGQIPSSCGVRQCTTSQDCADIGSGYFCDTPNSGCCDNPPDLHQRCIAPCESPDAPPNDATTPTEAASQADARADTSPADARPDTSSIVSDARDSGPSFTPADASFLIGGGEPFAFTQATTALLAQAARARAGVPADLDGDDSPEFFVTYAPAGAVSFRSDPNHDGIDEIRYEFAPATGVGSLQIDSDGDGRPEYEATFSTAPDTSVELIDDDFDGAFDSRTTEVYDWTAGTVTITVETDPGHDGGFMPVRTATVPIARSMCGDGNPPPPGGSPCDGSTPFPTIVRTGGNALFIADNGGTADGADGSCSKAHTEKLKKAFDCALSRGESCLSDTNTPADLRLQGGVALGSLDVGCGNGCSGNSAVTTTSGPCPWWKFGGCTSRLNVNPRALDAESDPEACSMVLHEMLHWVHVTDASDRGGYHDDGVDRVYACSRYCAGCVNTNANTPSGCGVTPNLDCTRCADTKARKKACGYKEKVGPSESRYAVCHAGLSCLLGTCTDTKAKNVLDCDDKMLEPGPVLCCATCPSGCDTTNDIPCGTLPTDVDHCSDPPPACMP